MINEINSFFQSSPWYNILALTTTLIGTIYGVASFIIGNRKRIPVYAMQTAHLIRDVINENDNIKITYKDQEFPNLSSTKFVFWNRGRLPIKSNDIASKNPIKISIDEKYQILDAFIDKQTDKDNNFVLEKTEDNKCLIVKFEFLEYNDGVSIRIIHTAPSNNDFSISGKVISGVKLHNAYSNNFRKGLFKAISFISFSFLPFRHRLMFIRGLFFFMGILLILSPLISHMGLADILMGRNDSVWYYIFIYPMGVLYMLFALFALRRYIPKSLED